MELTHLATSTSRSMPLTEVFDDPGTTSPSSSQPLPEITECDSSGQSKAHPIDETFDSGPGHLRHRHRIRRYPIPRLCWKVTAKSKTRPKAR